MDTYIAFLRSINVGKTNRIKMSDLCNMFSSLGLIGIKTYLQSGNVLFKSDKEKEVLVEEITKALFNNFSIRTMVILRTAKELEEMANRSPFSSEKLDRAASLHPESEYLYVDLLNRPFTVKDEENLRRIASGDDTFSVIGDNIYLLLFQSIRTSKLAIHLSNEKMAGTIRSLKTLRKILASLQLDSEY